LRSTVRRLYRVALFLTTLVGASGCATSFLYDRADRFADRWVGRYVSLDATQQRQLDAGLADLHGWHRREQLPAYAEWLRYIAASLHAKQSLSEAEVRVLASELREFWEDLASAALPVMAQLGATLSDAQAAELLASLREKQQVELEAAKRRPEAWHKQRRVRSMHRFIRRWIGPLTDEQRVTMEAWAAGLDPSRVASLENRAGWIDALELALGQRANSDALQATAGHLFVAPTDRWSDDYRGLVERNSARSLAWFATLISSIDDRQRERAIARLERLADELMQLSAVDG
jgi:hypothetical protein